MALAKITFIDQIEITRIGHIRVRFYKQIVDDDKVVASEPHRTEFECGGDIAGQMRLVNDHLARMGWPTISAGEWKQILPHAKIKWTAEVLRNSTEAKAARHAQPDGDGE